MYDPAGLKVGATQEGVTAKTEIPGKAPAFRLREKEQALSPFVVSDIEPVVAPLGFQRRFNSLSQSRRTRSPPLGGMGWSEATLIFPEPSENAKRGFGQVDRKS